MTVKAYMPFWAKKRERSSLGLQRGERQSIGWWKSECWVNNVCWAIFNNRPQRPLIKGALLGSSLSITWIRTDTGLVSTSRFSTFSPTRYLSPSLPYPDEQGKSFLLAKIWKCLQGEKSMLGSQIPRPVIHQWSHRHTGNPKGYSHSSAAQLSFSG